MEKNNIDVFVNFAKKAKKRIEAKKKLRTQKLYIPDMDETITIRAVTDQEILDCSEYSEDNNKNDNYLIYMACPDLQELAKVMMDTGDIKEHLEVVDMFDRADKKEIARRILTLSGVYDESSIKEVEEIKN